MPNRKPPIPITLARELRRDQTSAEQFVWSCLRDRQFHGHKFRRQAPIGPYFADFVCFDRRLIVELDGAHHAEPEQQQHDQRRGEWLREQGFRVLRFDNREATEGWSHGTADRILAALRENPPPLPPLPAAGEGPGVRGLSLTSLP